MLVVITEYTGTLADVLPHEQAHIDWVTKGYEAGRILVSGPRNPLNGGVLVVRGDDPGEVMAWLDGDPFVANGLVTAEVTRFDPTGPPTQSKAGALFASHDQPGA